MPPAQKQQRPDDDDRAKKTLYVTGFNSKHTTKQLLKELFSQGGPITDITMFDTHAYVRFQHEESVPYCLALFNEVELFGDKLRLNPRYKSANTFCYMKYLSHVRTKLRDEYLSREPPKLPPKIYSESPKKSTGHNRTPTDSGKKRRDRGSRLAATSDEKQRDRKRSKSSSLNNSRNVSVAKSSTPAKLSSKPKRGRRGGQKKKSQKTVKTLRR